MAQDNAEILATLRGIHNEAIQVRLTKGSFHGEKATEKGSTKEKPSARKGNDEKNGAEKDDGKIDINHKVRAENGKEEMIPVALQEELEAIHSYLGERVQLLNRKIFEEVAEAEMEIAKLRKEHERQQTCKTGAGTGKRVRSGTEEESAK